MALFCSGCGLEGGALGEEVEVGVRLEVVVVMMGR